MFIQFSDVFLAALGFNSFQDYFTNFKSIRKAGTPEYPRPEVIIFFSYSTQLSMKFFLLINIKMPTIVGILMFISRKNFMVTFALQEKSLNWWYLIFYKQKKFHSQLS